MFIFPPHLVVSVGENGLLGVHQHPAGLLLHPVEGGGLHGDVRGLDVIVEHLGRHHTLQRGRAGERRAGGFCGEHQADGSGGSTWDTLKTM